MFIEIDADLPKWKYFTILWAIKPYLTFYRMSVVYNCYDTIHIRILVLYLKILFHLKIRYKD